MPLRFNFRTGTRTETVEIPRVPSCREVLERGSRLHLLGLDHKKLTYLHNGRSYRLTDVAGNIIRDVLSSPV